MVSYGTITEQRRNHVLAVYDEYSKFTPKAIVEYFSADVTVEDIAIGQTFHGRDELAEVLTTWFECFYMYKITVNRERITENFAAFDTTHSCRLRGDFPGYPFGIPDGIDCTFKLLSLIEFSEDGLIQRQTDSWNMATLLQQAGVLTIPEG